MRRRIVVILCLAVVLVGCSGTKPLQVTPDALTPTGFTEPTATERPMAIRVNGEGVWMEEYQASMQQIQHAQEKLGLTLSEQEAVSYVVDDLVQTTLLAQEAYASGYATDEALIQQKLSQIRAGYGGEEGFNSWMSENGYTIEVFTHAFIKSEAAAWQIDKITSAVPLMADQVHARQILTSQRADAEEALQELNNGYDFTTLAKVYEPLTGGDLGWFPRGYLLQPLVEEAVFSLEIGQFSGIIETPSGFTIVYVVEREPARALAQDALLTLQDAAVASWMENRVTASVIEVYVP